MMYCGIGYLIIWIIYNYFKSTEQIQKQILSKSSRRKQNKLRRIARMRVYRELKTQMSITYEEQYFQIRKTGPSEITLYLDEYQHDSMFFFVRMLFSFNHYKFSQIVTTDPYEKTYYVYKKNDNVPITILLKTFDWLN